MSVTTEDRFLGGKLILEQPSAGYRAGADPVILASAVPATPGQSVLDLGVGVGVALYSLCRRVPGLDAVGVDVQQDLCELARRNAARNEIDAEIVQADIADMPATLRARSFDHVLTNPPYFRRNEGYSARAPGRETGRGEGLALADWLDLAIKRLKPGGHLTVVQRAERLPDLLAACDTRMGDIAVRPLTPRQGRKCEIVLLTAKKGARGAFRLLPSLYLHIGTRHETDGDDYSPVAKSVLRDGLGLEDALLMHR